MAVQQHLVAAIGDERGTGAADRLCEACVALFEVDAAAISVVFDGINKGTLGASRPPARVYDELQFTLGEGPCLDSVAHRAPVIVVDLADPSEDRWPAYGSAMLGHHIRSVFAMPVVVAGEYLGALDLFRAAPGVLAAEELVRALLAAELAELPLLDLIGADVRAAVENPDSNAWAELNVLLRSN